VAPPDAVRPASAEEELPGRYRAYLAGERGLVPAVVSQFVKAAALFLDQYPGAAAGQPGPDAAAVSAFCVRELPRRGRAGAANLAAALRSFLRFLYLEGLVGTPVAQAVPAVANRRLKGAPADRGRGLPRERAGSGRMAVPCCNAAHRRTVGARPRDRFRSTTVRTRHGPPSPQSPGPAAKDYAQERETPVQHFQNRADSG